MSKMDDIGNIDRKFLGIIEKLFRKNKGDYSNEEITENVIKSYKRGRFFKRAKFISLLLIIIVGFCYMYPPISTTISNTWANQKSYFTKKFDKADFNDPVKLAELKNNLLNSILNLISVKNRNLEGIKFVNWQDNKKIIVIPKEIEPKIENTCMLISAYIFDKYNTDSIVFGKIYTGLNGSAYWTDFSGKYETDLELIAEYVKKKDCKKIFSACSNAENRNLPFPFIHQINGQLQIFEEDERWLGYLWSTGNKIVKIESINLKMKIDDQEIIPLVIPGEKNVPTKVKSSKSALAISNFPKLLKHTKQQLL